MLDTSKIREHMDVISSDRKTVGQVDHLEGSDIPIGARSTSIADSWDAMVSDRPYRAGLDHEEAVTRLRQGAGTQWDAGLVRVFLDLLDGGLTQRVTESQLAAIA